jgi:hypothetical protein
MSERARQHVALLGACFIVWGGLCLLVGFAWLALGVGAASMTREVGSVATAAGVGFAVAAVVLMLWGAANVWTGIAARRYRPWGRALGLALGVLNLLFIPFGTALGVYAMAVLLNDQVRRRFVSSHGA